MMEKKVPLEFESISTAFLDDSSAEASAAWFTSVTKMSAPSLDALKWAVSTVHRRTRTVESSSVVQSVHSITAAVQCISP